MASEKLANVEGSAILPSCKWCAKVHPYVNTLDPVKRYKLRLQALDFHYKLCRLECPFMDIMPAALKQSEKLVKPGHQNCHAIFYRGLYAMDWEDREAVPDKQQQHEMAKLMTHFEMFTGLVLGEHYRWK